MKSDKKSRAKKYASPKKFQAFLAVANQLKFTERFTTACKSDKKDNSASHTWQMSLMAIFLADEVSGRLDLLKALKMIAVHDLPEAIAGDISTDKIYKGEITRSQKVALERKGLQKIGRLLPPKKRKELLDLWEEFEEGKTPEAKFAKVMDKLEMFHHMLGMKNFETYRAPYFDRDVQRIYGLIPSLDKFVEHARGELKKECRRVDIPWHKAS